MKRSSPAPAWNLRDLFESPHDPAIEKLFQNFHKRAERFAKTYRPLLKDTLSPAVLRKALQEYETILQHVTKPPIYATLLVEADASQAAHNAFRERMQSRALEIEQILVFFEVGLSRLSEATFKRLLKAKELREYAHYLSLQWQTKAHRLDEREEQLMNDLRLTGRMAFIRLFNEELSLKQFHLSSAPRSKTASEAELLNKLHDPSRAVRKNAAHWFTHGLTEEARRLTFIFNTLMRDKQVEDRYRRFPSPEAERHLANETTQQTVDTLAQSVTESYGLVQTFYDLTHPLLGLAPLYDYDRYAPLPGASERFSFDEARDIILTAFRSFSPRMADIAQKFFQEKWIDASIRPGKRSGAFCMFVTPDCHPYILVNFQGTASDVMTLAHELGHGVHAYLAQKQRFLNFNMPLTVAETASVFGEMLVFDHLRRHLKRPEDRFALTVGKIESMFATVHRQISMYRFEQDIHTKAQETGELTTKTINDLWRTRQKEMFGNAVTLTKDYDIWWSYISHFVHAPFYVYSYAFGELLTLALFARYKRDGKTFVDEYLKLLEKGGSESPDELVKPFGIRLQDRAFWDGGLHMIRELIKDAKHLRPSK